MDTLAIFRFARFSLVGPLVAVFGVSLALLAAGCGEVVLDASKTEDAVQQDLEKQLGVGAEVDCPAGLEVEAGVVFTCSVELANGRKGEEKLKIVNDDADLHSLSFRYVDGSAGDGQGK